LAGGAWWVVGGGSGGGVRPRGEVVVGAARRPERLDDLVSAHPGQMHAIALDVTDADRCRAVVAETVDRFGRIDVLVNNAGRTQVGALEETTDEELRYLFDLHFFGPAALTRAVLPHMRRAGGGAVVQMSSTGGQIGGPGFGAYCATKHALEGLTEALRLEVDFGVRFLTVEPGAFRTNLFGRDAAYVSTPMPEYERTVGPTREFLGTHGQQAGDPAKAARAILAALDAPHPPSRLPLGGDAVDVIRSKVEAQLAELAEWEGVSRDTAVDA
jgi:NAD(P)-dependent dehydrogenase (short-subunit alcohol dehydrogenase family)